MYKMFAIKSKPNLNTAVYNPLSCQIYKIYLKFKVFHGSDYEEYYILGCYIM
jgi:hypothetical protein